MTTFRTRHNRNNPYVMLNKGFLEDPQLSAKAKGILAYLLSRPDDWQTHTDQLIKVMKDGRDSILSGLRELEQAGYFIRYPVRDEKTQQITHWVKDVFENPQVKDGKATSGKAVNGKAVEGNPSDGMPCEEMAVSLISNEVLSNDQLSTDLLTTDLLIPPTPPERKEKKEQPRNREKPPAPNINPVATLVKEEGDQKSTVVCEDKFSAAAPIQEISQTTNWRQERRREKHPNFVYSETETPWLNPDGQFKAEFVRWIANQWMEKFKGKRTIYEAEEDVLSNFFNEPDKIPLRWRTYSLNFNHHFERAAQRIASGGTVGEEERQYLENNLEAVRSPMPETLVSESKTLLGRDTTTQAALPESRPEGAEAQTGTYQIWKPKAELELSDEERAANSKRLTQMMAAAFNRKLSAKSADAEAKPTIFPLNPTVQQLQELLLDTAIRRDATFQRQLQQWLGTREDVVGDYDEHGLIHSVERF